MLLCSRPVIIWEILSIISSSIMTRDDRSQPAIENQCHSPSQVLLFAFWQPWLPLTSSIRISERTSGKGVRRRLYGIISILRSEVFTLVERRTLRPYLWRTGRATHSRL